MEPSRTMPHRTSNCLNHTHRNVELHVTYPHQAVPSHSGPTGSRRSTSQWLDATRLAQYNSVRLDVGRCPVARVESGHLRWPIFRGCFMHLAATLSIAHGVDQSPCIMSDLRQSKRARTRGAPCWHQPCGDCQGHSRSARRWPVEGRCQRVQRLPHEIVEVGGRPWLYCDTLWQRHANNEVTNRKWRCGRAVLAPDGSCACLNGGESSVCIGAAVRDRPSWDVEHSTLHRRV